MSALSVLEHEAHLIREALKHFANFKSMQGEAAEHIEALFDKVRTQVDVIAAAPVAESAPAPTPVVESAPAPEAPQADASPASTTPTA